MIHSKKVFALHACHLRIKKREASKGAASPYAKRGPFLQGVTFYPGGTLFPLCPRHIEIDGGLIKLFSFNFGFSLTSNPNQKGRTALPFFKMKTRAGRFFPLFYKIKNEAQRLCLPSSYPPLLIWGNEVRPNQNQNQKGQLSTLAFSPRSATKIFDFCIQIRIRRGLTLASLSVGSGPKSESESEGKSSEIRIRRGGSRFFIKMNQKTSRYPQSPEGAVSYGSNATRFRRIARSEREAPTLPTDSEKRLHHLDEEASGIRKGDQRDQNQNQKGRKRSQGQFLKPFLGAFEARHSRHSSLLHCDEVASEAKHLAYNPNPLLFQQHKSNKTSQYNFRIAFKNRLIPTEYSLETFHRSNQDTCLLHNPAVSEGDWVQSGDLLADCAASSGGELSLGKNILVAYMPWEGYNFEDAILISERLVFEDVYSSIHIERYDTEIRDTKDGMEIITRDIPELNSENLDSNGVAKLGSWIKEGDVLVGRVTPIKAKVQSTYTKLLNTILQTQTKPELKRDSSLRAPRGMKGKIVNVQIDWLTLKPKKVIKMVNVYLAEKRKIQVGDKMAGRHGNKGIVSQVLPRQDMPFLANGTPIDMVLNPLGVPSRMNVGQIYECLLGLAAKYLGEHYKIFPFDETYGPEASRSFVYSKLYEARKKTGSHWLFDPNCPGKTRLFDGRTGDPFDQSVTVGYAYMLKLVHLVDDKIHCLTPDHDILTSDGWIKISEVNCGHKIATLTQKGGFLVYQNPSEVLHYENYNGDLYRIKNANIDLLVTLDHRMWVKSGRSKGASFDDYQLIEAQKIKGKHRKYLKTANWVKDAYQFVLPAIISDSVPMLEKTFDMKAWLTFFGVWIAKGSLREASEAGSERSYLPSLLHLDEEASVEEEGKEAGATQRPEALCLNLSEEEKMLQTKAVYQVSWPDEPLRRGGFCFHLDGAVSTLGYTYTRGRDFFDEKIIDDKQLWSYLRPFSLGASEKYLPSWVWDLNQEQARLLIESMVLTHVFDREESISLCFYTSSVKLADDVMRLALHAGWSGNKSQHHFKAGNVGEIIDSESEGLLILSLIPSNLNVWRILIHKQNNPSVNHGHVKNQQSDLSVQIEEILPYKGPVFCLSVPNEVFYVRRDGKPVWTGNSRSTGPYSLVTQQPLRGRSKQGGQRLGEMEVWALEGYGAAFTLLEMLTIKSDDMTGRMTLWSNLILNKDLSIGTPESFKVLVCELQALCLDIGIFRMDSAGGKLTEIERLSELP